MFNFIIGIAIGLILLAYIIKITKTLISIGDDDYLPVKSHKTTIRSSRTDVNQSNIYGDNVFVFDSYSDDSSHSSHSDSYDCSCDCSSSSSSHCCD